MRNFAFRVILVTVLVAGSALGCSSDSEPATDVTTTAPDATSSSTTEQAATTPVNVYWAWSIPTSNGTPERLGTGGREASADAPARDALEALLSGPDATESEIGMGSEIPDGTRLLGIDIASGVATVDLSGEFEEPGGTLSEMMRLGQVVFTLTQFDTVDRVMFRIDGADRGDLGSHGIDVSAGVDRDGVDDVRPFILVEDPYPGAELADGFTLRGESNTFEGNVVWNVTDADGLIVADGFTTATAGNGEWGSFDTTVDIPDDLSGRGAVIVFETSAEDGSQANVVEYPVSF